MPRSPCTRTISLGNRFVASRRRGRVLAFQAVYAWELSAADQSLHFGWLTTPRSDEELVFPRLLAAGTIENITHIDSVIGDALEHWELSRLAKVDLAILRTSVYALLYREDIPARVSIDEAVEIAKEFGSAESYRFVNGVLDSIRQKHCGNRP